MYNKVFLEGNLTRDIEMKNTSSGLAIANSAIATTRKFKSKTGESKEEVLFVDLTFFGRTAEIAQQYLRKGSNILVDGRLQLNQWTDQSGQKQSKHSVAVETLQMISTGTGGNNPPKKGGYTSPPPSIDPPITPPTQTTEGGVVDPP